jgi:hypothetical protein
LTEPRNDHARQAEREPITVLVMLSRQNWPPFAEGAQDGFGSLIRASIIGRDLLPESGVAHQFKTA